MGWLIQALFIWTLWTLAFITVTGAYSLDAGGRKLTVPEILLFIVVSPFMFPYILGGVLAALSHKYNPAPVEGLREEEEKHGGT